MEGATKLYYGCRVHFARSVYSLSFLGTYLHPSPAGTSQPGAFVVDGASDYVHGVIEGAAIVVQGCDVGVLEVVVVGLSRVAVAVVDGDDGGGDARVRGDCGVGVPSETHLRPSDAGVGDRCCFDGVCGPG